MHWAISREQRNTFHERHFVEIEDLITAPPADLPFGRDLSRTDSAARTLAYNKTLATLAADFLGKTRLRFAFDQTDLTCLKEPLAQNFSIQGFLGGCYIAPSGQVTFFSPEAPISLFLPGGFLVGYCQRPVYLHNPHDPYNNALKALGYSFGDSLKEATHPTLTTFSGRAGLL